MNFRRRRYMAYLLRLWQISDIGSPVWRASLQDAHTGERRGFANLEGMLGYLRRETGIAIKSNEVSRDNSEEDDKPPE